MVTVANVVTTRTNATSRNARVTNSSAQEAERQKTQTPARNPPNGDKGGKGGGKGGGKTGPPNPQRRSSAPVATPTPAATPAPAAGDPKKRPEGDNATPEGNNSKKRHLSWMAKSLMAAGVDVKFPDEE